MKFISVLKISNIYIINIELQQWLYNENSRKFIYILKMKMEKYLSTNLKRLLLEDLLILSIRLHPSSGVSWILYFLWLLLLLLSVWCHVVRKMSVEVYVIKLFHEMGRLSAMPNLCALRKGRYSARVFLPLDNWIFPCKWCSELTHTHTYTFNTHTHTYTFNTCTCQNTYISAVEFKVLPNFTCSRLVTDLSKHSQSSCYFSSETLCCFLFPREQRLVSLFWLHMPDVFKNRTFTIL